MQVGDRITFPFGGKEKEGVVVRVFPKKVYLKADFPKHKGKLIVRTLAALEGKVPQAKKKPKVKKEKKRKEKKRRKKPPRHSPGPRSPVIA